MIDILLASSLLVCEDSYRMVERISKSPQTPNKEELIEVIKENTEPGCYEGSERNS